MPRDRWPETVVTNLKDKNYAGAAQHIGTDQTNDFISGPMHDALRKQLFDGIEADKVPEAIKPAELPLHLDLPSGIPAAMKEQFKLEAPLAVKSREGSGLFPF